jgi:predicted ester cyclase
MGMENFSSEFRTPEQYIIDITYRIWEERGVGRIYDWYAPDCPVRSPHSVSNTAATVVANTLSSMTAFPNRDLLADDVIIGDKPSGFYSSHRVRSLGVHLGDGYWGSATQRRIATLAVADCLCCDNRVVEEWVIGDDARVVLQLGLDPETFGRSNGTRYPEAYAIGNEAMCRRWADPTGLTSVGDKSIANRLIDTYAAIWNDKNLDVMQERYDRAVQFEGPAGHLSYGRAASGNVFTGILASIPDGRFEPYHIIVRQQAERAVRVALRWSYSGSHIGSGRYGEPTGSPVVMLGISHFELRDGLIANEWMVVDDTAIYAQIAAHQAARE